MTEQLILSIVDKYYPTSVGVILTGSQLNQPDFNLDHDIDLLVVDPQPSVISPLLLSINNARFDFTQIPLNDLENVLINESFDPKGLLFSMIVKGEILKDSENEVLKQLKNKVSAIYQEINPINLDEYNDAVRDLMKLKKDTLETALSYRRVFVVNQFMSLISKIELIKLSNWHNVGKHKADFLYQHNSPFVDDLTKIVEYSFIKEKGKPLTEIRLFIDQYLSTTATQKTDLQPDRYIIFDIRYKEITNDQFVLNSLQDIKAHRLLKKHFKYFYLSPKKYNRVYKNLISIVFEYDPVIGKKGFHDELRTLVSDYEDVQVSMIPSFEFKLRTDNLLIISFEPVAIELSKMIEILVKDNQKYDHARVLIIGIIIVSFILNYLKFELADLDNVRIYLCNRYLFTREEQDKAKKTQHYTSLRDQKYQLFNSYCQTNHTLITAAIKKGRSLLHIETDKVYFSVISSLHTFLVDYKHHIAKIDVPNDITLNIMSHQYKIKDPAKAYFFSILIDRIYPLLMLSPNQAALTIFSVAEALTRPGSLE